MAGRPADPAGTEWPIWWMTFLSLTGYNIAVGISPVLTALFLLCWSLYFLAWPARNLNRLLLAPLPFALPLLALASTLWSQAAVVTLRNAIELLLVTGIGVLIARAQRLRGFLSAFMCMMLVSVVVGAATGRRAAVGVHGDMALIGIFGSKNYFALMISMMMLSAAAVLADARQPRPLRLLGLFGLVIGPPLLVMAKSLGAMLTLFLALGCLGLFALAGRLSHRLRPTLYTLAALFVLAMVATFLLLQDSGVFEMLLRSAGKDTSLTGRTFLWSRADGLIPLHPLLGVGYQAFWVQESVEAEGLWRFSDIISRFGFHFHNLYYETAIELGYVGVAILGVTLTAVTAAALIAVIRRPCPEHAFLVSATAIFLSRAYVELDFLSPFSIGSLLLPIFWSYGAEAVTETRRLGRRPGWQAVMRPGEQPMPLSAR
jgi:exopolysaccharide production protein ExoQ